MKPKTEMDDIIDAAWRAGAAALGETFDSPQGRGYAVYCLLVAARGMLMSGSLRAPSFDHEVWNFAREMARETIPKNPKKKKERISTFDAWERLLRGEPS